jgi:carbonic anhydrase
MTVYEKLLQENKTWAREMVEQDPEYFNRLAHIQTPEFLWIGCSDSRVPADKITGTQPGEIFVHRNIANMVIHTDVNLFSVLDFAVNHLHINHIIVCGHYGCGGIKAAMTNHDYNYVLNMWLRNIKDVYRLYRDELESIEDMDARADRLSELNVKEQVLHLAKTSVIQRAWKYGKKPDLHGWIYGVQNGLIKPIFDMKGGTPIDTLYQYDDL